MTDEFGIAGKTLLVTGSGRNIGKAIVLEFAARGANVVINARSNVDEANEVKREAEALGAKALVVLGDAADKATVLAMKTRAEEAFGHVDIYVSNAARRLHKDFWETTDEDWDLHLNQQLTASWHLAKAFAPGMRERGWGRIVHMNGPDGWIGGPTRIPHSTAKGGLRTLTRSLARSLGPYGITVNDINPGLAKTVRDPSTHPGMTPDRSERYARETIAIKRQPEPAEIAWACAFLAAERSGAITGAALHVDGGQFMIG
ncbi:SDR family NAD(P)-dependent oxidoreductase [Actinoplanes sp. N902-109]|uniref:SDR family NAD(P)-dependent oxidoreductase n=1 Tax=Actinoplanes sp. (strain N902-109) TaxID=649831 RepID=UPI0005A2FDB4|nr:SDR family oxidoreductase [Actinoplanes sp. N902-109]